MTFYLISEIKKKIPENYADLTQIKKEIKTVKELHALRQNQPLFSLYRKQQYAFHKFVCNCIAVYSSCGNERRNKALLSGPGTGALPALRQKKITNLI